MFQPNPPQQYGGKTVKAPSGGGSDKGLFGELLGLAAGLGVGIGTGNWGPLISNELGPMAGGLYNGFANDDWSNFGFGGDKKKKDGGSSETDSDGSSKGTEDRVDDPNNPENDVRLAAEDYLPKLGQPLNQNQLVSMDVGPYGFPTRSMEHNQWSVYMNPGPKPLRDPMRWLGYGG